MRAQNAGWQRLRRQAGGQAPLLSAPLPAAAAAVPGVPAVPGVCGSCRGPVRAGQAHCYRCDRYRECLPGLLPDVVVPVAYAPKGGHHATNLWRYKSDDPGAEAARAALRALLLVFLRDHGCCVWRRAGTGGPSHAAVVPSCRGRAGPHPLQALAAPYLTIPWVRLSAAGGPASLDPDPRRFRLERIAGASVLLLDDTWTSGATATSAAAALRLAGARRVAVVVLGRHLDAPVPAAPYRSELCAVHAPVGTQ
jgi:hypothetical protein